MTKKIYGGYDVTHNATAAGKRTVQSIDENAVFDENGNMVWEGYTSQELKEIVSVIPLSHYGTHNYLPAGVSGDFLGASENPLYRRVKHFIERDGTYVALRSGTNGSVAGLYYSFLPDLLNRVQINGVSVNSNKQYRPGYIPAGFTPVSTISSDSNVVCGQLNIDNTTATYTSFYTSIMNGTLDDTQHTGFLIPSSTVLPDGGQLIYCMLGTDGYIYYYGIVVSNNAYQLSVVRVLFNASNGTYTSSRLTGFNGSIFYNMSNTNNIRIAGELVGTNISAQPYMLYTSALQVANPYMITFDVVALQDSSTGNIRVRINGDAYAATVAGSTRPQHGFSFTFNPVSKTVAVDAGYTTPGSAPLTVNVVAGVPIASGNVITTDQFYVHNNRGNVATTYNYTPLNAVIAVYTMNLQAPPVIEICKYSEDTPISPYQMLNFKQYTQNITSLTRGLMYEAYGSIIGSFITAPELLSPSSTKQVSSLPNGTPANSYAIHNISPTFTFGSLNYGSINGYQPTVQRGQIALDNTKRMFISTVNGSSVTANGGMFIQGVRESTALSYDSNANGSGSFSVNSSQLLNLKNSEFSKFTVPLNPGNSKDCILYVPQQTDIPAFALLSSVTTNNQYAYRFIEVNVSSRTGNITTISFKRLVDSGVISTFTITGGLGRITDSCTGVTIYNGGSFYFVGGCDPITRNIIGDTRGYYFRGIVDKSSGQFTRFDMSGNYTAYTNGEQPFALPGQGFGVIRQIDLNCKQAFFKYGTTIADYDAWTQSTADPLNVVSQDVASGFVVYFTEETPVMLSGKSFTLPISSVDLTTITPNPANKTFNIYVQMIQGIAQYTISESVIAETGTAAYNLFWIGTVTTNNLQISNINILKRSRLDIFGESLVPAGGSFPVSFGTPAGTGTINW